MHALGFTIALVTATVAGAPALPVDVPRVEVAPTPVEVPRVELPPLPVEVPRVELPPVNVPRVEVPPPVEEVLPDPPPVSPPSPPPEQPPARTAEPATPEAQPELEPVAAPPAAAASPRPQARPAATSHGGKILPASARRQDLTPRAVPAEPGPPTGRRPATRSAASPPPRLRPPRDRTAAAPRPTVVATPARPAPPRATPDEPSGLGAGVVRIVRVLPPALLWALGAVSALALALAGNALRQARRRAALAAQREALLADVGLLSAALLPPVPARLDGLAVSAAYRPADGPAAGGDFYDVFALGEGRTGVLLGDVSGHGRDSVAASALARYTLRTLLAAGHGPGEALARADRLLHRDLAPDFVTVIAGVYDHAREELTYAKAGHAPPIVLGVPHDPDAEEPACPLAIGVGTTWPEYRLRMTPSAAVCLFTDGLEDARRAGDRLGRDEVERLLAARPAPDAATLLADVAAVADRMPDDTAAVVLRRVAG